LLSVSSEEIDQNITLGFKKDGFQFRNYFINFIYSVKLFYFVVNHQNTFSDEDLFHEKICYHNGYYHSSNDCNRNRFFKVWFVNQIE
jgi:hypothetical protein